MKREVKTIIKVVEIMIKNSWNFTKKSPNE